MADAPGGRLSRNSVPLLVAYKIYFFFSTVFPPREYFSLTIKLDNDIFSQAYRSFKQGTPLTLDTTKTTTTVQMAD